MSAVAELNADSTDLESLFDGIVEANAAAPAQVAAMNDATDGGATDVISRVGKMTRALHDSLRALGYDKMLESAAASIPDARDRLSYVATMTEQAAQRVLSAIETAKPVQDKLAADAGVLTQRWDSLFAAQPGAEELKALVTQTRAFLGAVPEQTRSTNAQLTEIMMAQDFQDLTGQVIKKIAEIVHQLENQMLSLLLDNAAPDKRQEVSGLLCGPVINGNGRTDVVTSQKQVDELLESLGF